MKCMKNLKLKYKDNYFEVKYDNCFISFLIEKEVWEKNGLYKNLNKQFNSNIRLISFYSQYDINKPRIKKGLSKKLFYYSLNYLLSKKIININDIIVLEANPSNNNSLVEKVYIPMGFKIITNEYNDFSGFTLMSCKVVDILIYN